jgi:hypothetical protein
MSSHLSADFFIGVICMSIHLAIFFAWLFVALLASPLVAQVPPGMPHYDVNGYCASESAAMGGGDMGISLCVGREQYAYKNLKVIWSGVDPAIQQLCIQKTPIASYSRLHSCVLNEQSNRLLTVPRFQH